MSEKLTLPDAMKYPNAEIQYAENIKCSNIVDYFYQRYYNKDFDYIIDDCQLILRSIDDLTEKEKKVIAKISLEVSEVFFQFVRYEMCCMEDYLITIKDKKCIDYLRSINIDIDGFIENGKAVKG